MGKLKVVDINKKESEKEVKEILSLSKVIENIKEKFPGLVHWRVPVCNSAAPLETDFDIITQTLLGSAITTPVIINDQVGLSRATTGCVIACLFKEFQITSSFEGLVETVPGMNLNLLKMDTYKMDMPKDTLFRGEFPVVQKLVEKLADGAAAKNVCDKVVDKNGTPKTGGTGIKQLRENIAESKLSYEIMDDAAQAFLKSKTMDNIHKYFQTAHLMFGDMPQGDHKKRAKYRFASKTLMRLLPKELLGQVEGLIEKKTITLDLYDILGQCTWGQK